MNIFILKNNKHLISVIFTSITYLMFSVQTGSVYFCPNYHNDIQVNATVCFPHYIYIYIYNHRIAQKIQNKQNIVLAKRKESN